jgi:hypothetical protein
MGLNLSSGVALYARGARAVATGVSRSIVIFLMGARVGIS